MRRLPLLACLLLPSLLLACDLPDTVVLEEELAQLDPPFTYSVRQHASDTGIEGFEERDAFEETFTFTVLNGVVENAPESAVPLMTMQDVGQELRQYVTLMPGQHPANEVRCYSYEDVGAERVTACFNDHAIISFERVRTTGNFRREVLRWEVLP